MRTNLNTILAAMGVSVSLAIISTSNANGEIWYDSKGRPLVIKGREVIRKAVDKEEPEVADAVEEEAQPIIPKVLELRPELSNVQSRRSYQTYRSYYPQYYGYSGSGNYHNYQHGCYKPRRAPRSSFYLNYRRNGLNIRARY